MENLTNTDKEAITQFALDRKDKIVSYLCRRHKSISLDDAEDMAMMAITGFVNRFDASRGFKPVTYLYSCVNNELSSWLRSNYPNDGKPKRKQTKLNTDNIQYLEFVTGEAFDIPSIDAGFCGVEDKLMIRSVLGILTDNERKVLGGLMRGMSVDEISAATKISKAYVYQVVTSLRLKLVKNLGLDVSGTEFAKTVAYRRAA